MLLTYLLPFYFDTTIKKPYIMKLKHLIIKAFRGKRAYYKEKLALAETALRDKKSFYMCHALANRGLSKTDLYVIGFNMRDFHQFVRIYYPHMCSYMVVGPEWLGTMSISEPFLSMKLGVKADYLKHIADRL